MTTFKVGDRVKRVEMLDSRMSEYFRGEPFEVQELRFTYVVDPNGEQHDPRYLRPVEGPVRTVTRQEIIPGTYDGVKVGERMSNEVWVGLSGCMDHAALTRAAAVLTALADALKAEAAPR